MLSVFHDYYVEPRKYLIKLILETCMMISIKEAWYIASCCKINSCFSSGWFSDSLSTLSLSHPDVCQAQFWWVLKKWYIIWWLAAELPRDLYHSWLKIICANIFNCWNMIFLSCCFFFISSLSSFSSSSSITDTTATTTRIMNRTVHEVPQFIF